MSDDEQIAAGPSGATPGDLQPPADKLKYKSWRKKYRKMKAHFDQVLKENNASFIEEQKLETLNKRLQEQNEYVSSNRYAIPTFHLSCDNCPTYCPHVMIT